MIQQNIYSPDQGIQKNPGNSTFVSKLDPALKQLGSSMKQQSETRKGTSNTWKRTVEKELGNMKLSWSEAESKAQDLAEYRRRPVLRQELKGKEEEAYLHCLC